ncbi:MAG: MFS transporter [Thaumarchaeota archaeon]|nr:MFS transporter [Nitrososphaerota archaeon]MCL5067997.1 MFS transporter [Nitrososphaerota archaeon]
MEGQEQSEAFGGEHYRTIALSIIMMGVMMSAVDTTAVVLGLPVMMIDLHSDIISMIWVIMAYLLVITILGTQVGRFGDMFGRVRMYNLGFAIFTVSSLLCGISSTGSELIAFRVMQGIGGALISSNSGAVIADTFKESERGKAYGYTGIGWSIGAILGILIGGAFVTFLDWRYIFFINLPIGTVATLIGYLKLRERSPKLKRKVDIIGMALLGTGLFLSLYALTEITGFGFIFYYTAILCIGILAIIAFALWERHTSVPLIQIEIVRERVLISSILAAFLQSLAGFAVLFLVIMYLQGPRAMTPFDAALLLIPAYVLGGLVSPFSGRLSDKFGARVIATIGLIIQASGFIVYSSLGIDSSFVLVIFGAVLNGIGSSSFFPANNSAVMSAAPQQAYGIASGLLRTFSNIGMVCSFAVALLIASLSIPRDLAFKIFLGVGKMSPQLSQAYVVGMRAALFASIALLVIALSLSVLRGKERRTTLNRKTGNPRTSGNIDNSNV